MCAARPDGSRRAGEWIGRYVQRQLRATGHSRLSYALTTHLHGDHIGDVTEQSPISSNGDCRLTGVSDVAELVPIDALIDRGYPTYDLASNPNAEPIRNYASFVRDAVSRGMRAERVKPGSASQIGLRYDAGRYPKFGVRMIAGNGAVWTDEGEGSRTFAKPDTTNSEDVFTAENRLSIALRIRYGRFSYFTGGDLNCDTDYGREPGRDVESPAARAAGPVSVSTCDHHGYFDACGPEFVRALQPRVWILQSWHASQPAISTLANLYSKELYPGPRDVFCTGLHPAAALTCARFSDQFKSRQGHVVVRVAPSGEEFRLIVIEDGDESGIVKDVFGPYRA